MDTNEKTMEKQHNRNPGPQFGGDLGRNKTGGPCKRMRRKATNPMGMGTDGDGRGGAKEMDEGGWKDKNENRLKTWYITLLSELMSRIDYN